MKRGAYAEITDADVTHFERLLGGSSRVITDESEAQGHNVDFLGSVRGDYLLSLLYVYTFAIYSAYTLFRSKSSGAKAKNDPGSVGHNAILQPAFARRLSARWQYGIGGWIGAGV